MRELRKGEVGTSSRIGYSLIVQETGGRKLEITPRQGITEKCLALAINHTCHSDFEDCTFLLTGITKDSRGGGQEDEGGVGGRRTSVVFVQATRRVERDEEFLQTTGQASGFLMGVSAICMGVMARRHIASLA
jgi:hypothetical protein